MPHPTIQRFEQRAALLQLHSSPASISDAITSLAIWMDTARDHLTREDLAILENIGAVLSCVELRVRLAKKNLA